ncbi:hypothetical protein [Phormidium sp. CCY1219]|jgi:hypothetical protein|uniref:hypothetical protein n=1 Tax=Phormidium sp. CCY1219 TaxID=2886104 RepID=UPI002D1EFAA9|nr:hypothetical protein [Phormidium sp. CCY1219]MEB3831436.1 hypothetical protein [Phormidium sp. CCY1219]
MTDEANVPKERALVEVSPETKELIDREMPNETEQIKQETMALFEAVKRRAQTEIQGASQFTTDAYLNAVEQAKAAVEQERIMDPERIAYTFKLMEMDARQNWDNIVKEISDLGDRLSESAKQAWDSLFDSSK